MVLEGERRKKKEESFFGSFVSRNGFCVGEANHNKLSERHYHNRMVNFYYPSFIISFTKKII